MYQRHRTVLANGLPVLTLEVPHLHSAMVAVYVRVGSRHESPEKNGVSHFLEHIFFRGCEDYPDSTVLNTAVERLGGSLNGVTARDHGFYYTAVHPDGVPLALSVAGAMLRAPLVKELDLEREVILEEILDEVDERGRVVDVDRLSKSLLFDGHGLALPIAGTRETVSALGEADLREHHRRFYGAANLVVVVAGPVAHARVVEAAEAAFGAFPTGRRSTDAPPPPFPLEPVTRLVSHAESQTELRLSFPSLSERHPDYPAVIVLRRILDDGLASRLQQGVVERRGLAYSVGAGVDVFAETGVFEIEASAAHAKVPELLETLLGIARDLTERAPEADELERAKARYRYAVEFMADSVGDLAGWFADGELFDLPTGLEERVAAVQAVTADDVVRVARESFATGRRVAVVVGKAPEKATRKALEASDRRRG